MDETRKNIINESTRTISKLQLLTVFFNNDTIYKIYLRTQVIHQLFVTNPELDISKLELFHIQFTDTLIDLLKKIKKTNESRTDLLLDEVQLNNELINQMDDTVFTENDYNNDKQRQALKMSQSLRKLFEVLSNNLDDYPFAKNINLFSSRYAADYFAEIPVQVLDELLQYNPADLYTDKYATIQRKLMGRLNKYDFKVVFHCGLKTGNVTLEVYKFSELEEYFLYSPVNNIFLFCDIKKIGNTATASNLSKKERVMQELLDKNVRLQSSAGVMKTHLPTEVLSLLEDNYKKIAGVDFLQQMDNFDIQANILKQMLNTDII
ncbi:hypothetical protein [Mucilaginibacter pedocola]|uniref:Uncharacterized protein n=1 Tax=Mucilaginibacter pedocola TaxID=1792845 RepID=A0A1S9PIR0_9SPHI|nr:hypothetical protein [Mucilaginibacter pedocola]OOQ60833.1 hypothetical protein BC343_22975 [Mucilaginibacter pedocola]